MNELTFERVFDVPVEILYKAWTDPGHLSKWWGPEGFTNTFHEFDLRPGGKWIFTMHGPDGRNFPNESHFVSVEENKCLVFDHVCAPLFRAEAVFQTVDEKKSLLVWKTNFPEEKVYHALKNFVREKNKENLDRLEAELRKMK